MLINGVVWITCGLLWCFYQLFGLSLWRHPFTAEDPLRSKWCDAKLGQFSFLGEPLNSQNLHYQCLDMDLCVWIHTSRWTSTSHYRCCSVWQRILNIVSSWTGRHAVTPLWSRCVWWLPSPSHHIQPPSTAQGNPSTPWWERPMSWTVWRSTDTAPSVNRSETTYWLYVIN